LLGDQGICNTAKKGTLVEEFWGGGKVRVVGRLRGAREQFDSHEGSSIQGGGAKIRRGREE